MRLRRTILLSVLLAPVLLARPGFGADESAVGVDTSKLAAHRAVYHLTLDSSRNGEVTAAGGQMNYEVVDACDGWATQQRLQMTITNRDGQNIEMVSDYATWESKDGLKMRFRMRQTTDTAVTEQVEGDASLQSAGGPGTIHYTVPEDKMVPMPRGTVFPMTHTAVLIAAAEAHKQFITLPIFDGTGAKGAQDSSVAIASWGSPAPSPYPGLAELPSGRVRIAFFDRTKTEQAPDYEVGMRYWQNGVADDLSMDFSEFVMRGKLAEFTFLPPHC